MNTVSELMTSKVHTMAPDDDLMKATAIMQNAHIRHIPVVRDDKVVGLITHRDLLRAQIDALGKLNSDDSLTTLVALPASERMRRNLITIAPDAHPVDAARAMLQGKLGCLLVVDPEDKLEGIVTEADFVKWALEREGRA